MQEYITYAEYSQRSGVLSETDFARARTRAQAELDRRTFGRLRNDAEISPTVKDCLAEMIDVCAAGFAAYGGAGDTSVVQSVSNDGVTINYAAISQTDWYGKIYPHRVADIVDTYLADERSASGVPLLYRGGVYL